MKESEIPIQLVIDRSLKADLEQQFGKMPAMWHNIFDMFAAFIGKTDDFGDAIKREFPYAWKVVNLMEGKK